MILSSRIFPFIKRVFLALFILFACLSLLQMTLMSFSSTLPRLNAEVGEFTFANYTAIWSNPQLRSAFGNSIAYVLINICATVPVAIPAAYAFSRLSFVGDRHLFLVFIVFRITPPVVLTLPILQLFSQLGVVNSVFGIALAHCLFNLLIFIWILQGFISAIPKEMNETAFLDVYLRPWVILTFILPQISSSVTVTAFFYFIFSWVEAMFARILITTNWKPISMAINALFGFHTDIGLVMAVTTASMSPGTVLLFAMRNHLSCGFKIGRV